MSQEEVVIEPMQADDISQVAILFTEDMDDLGVETTKEHMLELAEGVFEATHSDSPECLCFVARLGEDDEAVGVVLANFNWSLKFSGRALWLEELYVTPRARRRGLGRILVETVLDWAEENDIRGIDLEAYRGNTPASILYRSLGFHRMGRERFYYRVQGSEFL